LKGPHLLVILLGLGIISGKEAILEGICVCQKEGCMIYLIIPPKKAISVPDLNGVKKSAFAEERVNRGSTLMSLAPRFMASVTHLKEMG
jgi:hypothetical protein